MKKICIVLLVWLVSPLLLLATDAIQPAGSGTAEDPYRISSFSELYWISKNTSAWNAFFVQTADIDASVTNDWRYGLSPIGYIRTTLDHGVQYDDYKEFGGTYDGHGHTISGLYVRDDANSDIGLFGVLTSSGVVRNLGLKGCEVKGYEDVGGLVGLLNGGTVENCFTTGSVGYAGSSQGIGGLVGDNNWGKISRSYSSCSLNGSSYAGGLAGSSNGTVVDCYATGSVKIADNAGGKSCYAGGLLGFNAGSVSRCYSKGYVSADETKGGMVGYNNGTVDNTCFWDVSTSERSSGAGYNCGTFNALGKTTADIKNMDLFINAGWNFSSVWAMIGCDYPVFMNHVTGCTAPVVSNVALAGIGPNTANVFAFVESQGLPDAIRCGFCYSSIDSLPTINNDKTCYMGGAMSMIPLVKELTDLEKGNIYFVRAFATNPKSGETVYSPIPLNIYYPYIEPAANDTLALSVSCTDSFLVKGTLPFAATCDAEWLHLNTTSGRATLAGAPVYFAASVNNTGKDRSAVVKVSAEYKHPNFIEYFNGYCTIVQPASLLTVSDTVVCLDGVAGSQGLINVTATIPWKVASNTAPDWLEVLADSAEGNGTICFKTRSAVSLSTVSRRAVLTINDSVAISVYQKPGITPSGHGTEADPYLISTLEHLYWVTYRPDCWSRFFRQTADIDASGTRLCDNGAGFLPIGCGNFFAENPFTGTYDGNGFAVTNLYINRPQTEDVGLFGCVSGATIKQLGVRNDTVYGKWDVGGLLGKGDRKTTVYRCYSTGYVSGLAFVGGLIGDCHEGNVSSCYSTQTVRGDEVVGGLAGGIKDIDMTGCYFTGQVFGKENVGGLVGESNSCSISSCYVTGQVVKGFSNDPDDYPGAICGSNFYGPIKNCCWDKGTCGVDTAAGYDCGGIFNVLALSDIQMKDSAYLSGLGGISTVWQINQRHSYPMLRGMNNAPFAYPDTIRFHGNKPLYELFAEKCSDDQVAQKALVFRLDSVSPVFTADGLPDMPYTLKPGSVFSTVYRVGEQIAPGDTLWGNQVKNPLLFVNQPPVIKATVSDTTFINKALVIKSGRIHYVDADGDLVSVVCYPGANYMVSGDTIKPAFNFKGCLCVPVSLSDGWSLSAIDTMIIVVSDGMPSDFTSIGPELLSCKQLTLCPNPAESVVTINGLDHPAILRIHNMAGNLLLTKLIGPHEPVSITNLHDGLYFVDIENVVLKLIKR